MKKIAFFTLFLIIGGCFSKGSDSKNSTNNSIKQGEILFNQKHLGKNRVIGCVACHSIKSGQIIVGPSLAGLSIRAPHLVPNKTAKEYIKQSIMNPDAYVVNGFLPGTMYPRYSNELSEKEIDSLVSFLNTL